MKIIVYELVGSSTGNGQALLVPAGAALNQLPQEILRLLPKGVTPENAKPLKTLDLQPENKRIALDEDKAIEKINANGYYIASYSIESEITTSSTVLPQK
jgi:hypothetical protein